MDRTTRERLKREAAEAAKLKGTPSKAPQTAQEASKPEKPAEAPSESPKAVAGRLRKGKGRLPHGSTFAVVYDGKQEIWTGVLVTNGGEFKSSAGVLFTLLAKLDAMYRKSLSNPPENKTDSSGQETTVS